MSHQQASLFATGEPVLGGLDRGPDRARRGVLGHGDLIVTGGSCRRTWDHAIPRTRAVVGSRIGVRFRPRGVA